MFCCPLSPDIHDLLNNLHLTGRAVPEIYHKVSILLKLFIGKNSVILFSALAIPVSAVRGRNSTKQAVLCFLAATVKNTSPWKIAFQLEHLYQL